LTKAKKYNFFLKALFNLKTIFFKRNTKHAKAQKQSFCLKAIFNLKAIFIKCNTKHALKDPKQLISHY
jgi:hypothetical protein